MHLIIFIQIQVIWDMLGTNVPLPVFDDSVVQPLSQLFFEVGYKLDIEQIDNFYKLVS